MFGGLTLPGLALRNLVRRPARTLLTITGVAVAIAAFVALTGLARGVEMALRFSLDVRETDIVVSERGAVDLVSSIVPDALALRLSELPGIAAASPELVRLTALPDGTSVPVVAWPSASYLWRGLTPTRGRLAQGRLEVVLGSRLAEHLELEPNDSIELFHATFVVVGVIDSQSMLNRNLAFALLDDVQELTYRSGQATSIHVSLEPQATPAERDRILASMQERFSDFAVDAADLFSGNNAGARVARALSWSISVAAIAIAAINVFNTMGMAVNERRHEIAIMRAVGWPRRRILACIIFEGLALCAVGGAVGSTAGYVGAWTIARTPAVVGLLEPTISLAMVIYASVATLLLGALGSVVPAIRATSIEPAEVLSGR